MRQEKILESFLKVIGKKTPFKNMSPEEKNERLKSMKQTQKEIQINKKDKTS